MSANKKCLLGLSDYNFVPLVLKFSDKSSNNFSLHVSPPRRRVAAGMALDAIGAKSRSAAILRLFKKLLDNTAQYSERATLLHRLREKNKKVCALPELGPVGALGKRVRFES